MPSYFQVGLAVDPKDDDPKFSEERAAIEFANGLTLKSDLFTTAIVVWDERCNPVYLFMLGEMVKAI